MKTLHVVSLIWSSDEPPLLITTDKDAALAYAEKVASDPREYAREADDLGKGDDEAICVRVYSLVEGRPHITGLVASINFRELAEV
jgi:hypothetical protein